MSIVLDALLVLIVLFYIWRSAKRGFVRTIIEMVGYILSLVVAFSAAGYLSGQIYESFVRPSIVKSIEANLNDYDGNNVSNILNSVRNNIPSYMLTAANYDTNVESVVAEEIQKSKGQAKESAIAIADTLAKPAMIYILRIILIFVLFTILMFLVRFLAKSINRVFNLPILGTANQILGGVLGIVKGAVVVILLCALISISIKLFGDQGFINQDIVNNTYLYRYIVDFFAPFIP
ncbi:MAG: hypothetical protein BGN88_14760 [Clostridiales bacterium 43-6]|nr:MAG: hypothetical protein BGN88_14760 [Clostridiales bacterium 43-6]